ncbi:unnamed protein product [Mytilus edulis]|uniref:Uncharacterized protein n=1 Tax=Mytilus edulis TaxID=6550 RepID=A0A8S3V1T9_MYTED|nr:unnamed protein product [Mytilus edulis]
MDENTRWEYCDIPQCGLSTEAVTVTNTQATSEMSVSTELSTTSVTVTKTQSTSATSVSGIGNIDKISTETVTETKTQATSTTPVAGIGHTDKLSTETVTVTKTQATSTTTMAANGEWSIWNDWKFCEVNCIREDTTEGKQKRWRTCRGSKCSGMRPRKLSCKCPKRLINTKWHNLDGKNITNYEVKEKVLVDFNKNIKSDIEVNKKTVSKTVRRKISSVNKRQSSQSIGWGCIVFLVLPVGFLIAIDILKCYIHFRARCSKRNETECRQFLLCKIMKIMQIPCQKNVDTTEECYASGIGNNRHPGKMKLETYKRRDDNKQTIGEEWL